MNDLKPGPELDKLVAKATGEPTEGGEWFCPKCNSLISDGAVTYQETHAHCDCPAIWTEFPLPFSTNSGEAIKALEKFCDRIYQAHQVRLRWKITSSNECEMWGFSEVRQDGSPDCYSQFADTVPWAICLAIVAVEEGK